MLALTPPLLLLLLPLSPAEEYLPQAGLAGDMRISYAKFLELLRVGGWRSDHIRTLCPCWLDWRCICMRLSVWLLVGFCN